MIGMAAAAAPAPRQAALARTQTWRMPDARRSMQLALAAVWLLDAVLQLQPVMFTRTFGTQIISSVATGNPSIIARSILWSGQNIAAHAAVANAVFTAIQLLIALGIAWRPTVKGALAVSIAWSIAVWWIGEGLGGILTSGASPVTGAPGGVILYAILAVLLWPTGADSGERAGRRSLAANKLGALLAAACWAVFWALMAVFELMSAIRAPHAVADAISAMEDGEPGWLAAASRWGTSLMNEHGLAVGIALAAVFALVAISVFLRASVSRAAIGVLVVVVLAIWVVGEGLGGLFSGSATDPNSAPLLVLIAMAYWPLAERVGHRSEAWG
jgi:hypothetical protein